MSCKCQGPQTTLKLTIKNFINPNFQLHPGVALCKSHYQNDTDSLGEEKKNYFGLHYEDITIWQSNEGEN